MLLQTCSRPQLRKVKAFYGHTRRKELATKTNKKLQNRKTQIAWANGFLQALSSSGIREEYLEIREVFKTKIADVRKGIRQKINQGKPRRVIGKRK